MKTRYNIFADVYDKDRICIGTGTNSYKKSHPLQAYFAKKVGRPEQIYLHAEIQAILKAKDKQIEKITIYRIDKFGNKRNAKPCPICMEAIKAFGIKKITYTTDSDFQVFPACSSRSD